MRYLDTCICIEFLRGRLRLGYQVMREEGPEGFAIPAIVAAELWYGAEHSARSEKEKNTVATFIEAFEIVPFDGRCAREYGRLRQLLGSKGAIIGDRDLMIAATAMANKAVLVTNNAKDFKRIPDLPFESWAEIDLPTT